MAESSKITKRYIKTENLILFMLLSLALGFVGGVVFSAYQSAATPAGSINAGSTNAPSSASAPMTRQQQDTLAALIKATETTPENVTAWTQLGHFYFDGGQFKKAIESYKKSLALDDKRPNVWTDLGVMYRRNGETDQAIASFDRAMELNPRHEVAHFNKGVVLMHDKNDAKGALKTWEKLLTINPEAKTPSGQPLKTMVDELRKNASS